MNWLKKGPDLKLSEIKAPDFLFDLYYDLKERRLLPLVALLVVAIIAVPVLLSQASGSDSTEPEEIALPSPSAIGSGADTLVVAKAAPGLRDYRRRLRRAHALDPFQQPSEGAAAASSEVSAGAASGSSGEETSASFEESSAPLPSSESFPSEPAPTGGAAEGATEGKYAVNSIDVRIVTVPSADDGAKSSAKPKPEVRRNLPELTMLPSRETPAAIFMGTSTDGKKALLLVSSDVESIFGDGQCVVGSKTCQLLALEKGLPETFVYGPQARTYRIEILKIEKTLSNKPRRAALGSPKKDKGQEDPAAGGGAEPKPATKSPAGAG